QEKIQKEFQWLFVDEFQDTSPIQWEVIERLHEPGQNHLVIVGDPRQSIYRFRGARPHLFWEAMKHIEKSGGSLFHLDENFRSAPDIISFVNRLAPSLFPDFPRAMTARCPAGSSPEIDLMWFEKNPLETRRTLEAGRIAAEILKLHRNGTGWNRIALLFRTRRAMPYFEKTFRREQIPFVSASGESLLEQPEVIQILFYFRKILRPEDPLATLALSYSKTGRFSFTPPADEKLEKWIPGFFKKTDPANPVVQAFKDFILRLSEIDPSMTLEALLNTIHNLRSEEARIPCPDSSEEKNGVRLMTVHGAKGLEFPVVILCDLSARPSTSRPPWLEHPEHGVLFKEKEEIPTGLKEKLKKSDLFEELEKVESQAEDEESRRLLYVAMTRAQYRLILPLVDSKKSKGNLKTWNELLSGID
ncbi:MAG: UvrD-helicase domain-containing protein, partial [Deltaproteobacteria bacterium]|nr:UvrD-helicase domain-containing protein [Deltaproteobacteria bacterium]